MAAFKAQAPAGAQGHALRPPLPCMSSAAHRLHVTAGAFIFLGRPACAAQDEFDEAVKTNIEDFDMEVGGMSRLAFRT